MVVSKTKKTSGKLLRGDAIIISDSDNNYASGLRYRNTSHRRLSKPQNRTERDTHAPGALVQHGVTTLSSPSAHEKGGESCMGGVGADVVGSASRDELRIQGQVFSVLHELGDLARASLGDVPLRLPSTVLILQIFHHRRCE